MCPEKSYYFDANALLKFYGLDKELDNSEIFTAIRRLSINHTVYVSNLTYLETLGVLMKRVRHPKDRQKIDRRKLNQLIDQMKRDIGATQRHRFQLIPAQDGIFRSARALMTEHANKYELGVNDALHIAMVKTLTSSVIMVTSDGGKRAGKMKGVCAEIGLEVFDPEQL